MQNEINIYQKNNSQYFIELKTLVQSSKKWALQVNTKGRKRDLKQGRFPKYQYLKKWIDNVTPLLSDKFYTTMTKAFWILNNIASWNHQLVKCKNCGKPFVNKNVINTYVGYFDFCSIKCASSCVETRNKVVCTNTDRYGCHPSTLKEIQEKRKQTCLKKYGDRNFNNTKKALQSRLKHFGQYAPDDFKAKCCETKIKHGHLQNWNNEEQIKKTRFAKNNGAYESEQTKVKRQQTCLKHYGVKFNLQADEIKEKSKQTCLKKYGVEYVFQDKNFKNQARLSCLKKYGVEHSSQNHEISKKGKTKYKFQGMFFDSAPEIALFIWLTDKKIPFEYQPNITFEYEYEGKKHVYMPDFLIDGQLIEIKGDQFINKDGTWKNPFDRSQDALYEAKHQCILKNNIKILQSKDYQKYLVYVRQKYGKTFLTQLKIQRTSNKH